MKLRACELCGVEAAVYCPSDAAFLCCSCDARVHEANFLVARHIRQQICSSCSNFTGNGISGIGFRIFPAICSSCPPDDDFDSISSSSNSSDCISSTTSPGKGYSGCKRDARVQSFEFGSITSVNKVTMTRTSQQVAKSRVDIYELEGIFVNWIDKLGLDSSDVAVRMAFSAFRVCLDQRKIFPFRVYLAASMWLGLRLGGARYAVTRQILMRLEQISGVPARVIVAAEAKLARAFRARRLQRRRRAELEEGWAESWA